MSVLRPDLLETERDGEWITLTFRADTGESQVVSLNWAQLPTLVAQLVQETGPGQAVPIDQGSLQIGTTYSLQGYQVRRNTDGRRLLTLAIDLPDQGRTVTIPIELSPKEVADLIGMLGPGVANDN